MNFSLNWTSLFKFKCCHLCFPLNPLYSIPVRMEYLKPCDNKSSFFFVLRLKQTNRNFINRTYLTLNSLNYVPMNSSQLKEPLWWFKIEARLHLIQLSWKCKETSLYSLHPDQIWVMSARFRDMHDYFAHIVSVQLPGISLTRFN